MSRANRLEKLELQSKTLKREFDALLRSSLERSLAGGWGLFGGTPINTRKLTELEQAASELISIGTKLVAVDADLGYPDSYAPFLRFMEYRAKKGSNDLGDPRLAAQLLKELDASRDKK